MGVRGRLRIFALLAASAILTSTGLARQQVPVFSSRTDYVRVDVIVTDDDGQPISDLSIDDFAILQEGRAQHIADFEFVSVADFDPGFTADSGILPSSDVATNVAPPVESRAFVVVIDDRHLLTHDIPRVKDVLGRFIDGLGPADDVAIVFVGRSDLSVDFTRDASRLLDTIDDVGTVFGFGIDSRGPSENPDAYATARASIAVLRNVVRSLASSLHARRAMVLVSAGYTLDPLARVGSRENIQGLNMMLDLGALYDDAARANVPIYTLDPRGVVVEDMAVSDMQWLESGSGGTRQRKRAEVRRRIALQHDRLFEVASSTGGLAFVKRSDLLTAVDEIVADNGSYYLLGYYPTPNEADGKYHEIEVSVSQPGVRVRARKGFVATASSGALVDADQSFAEALGQGMMATDLRLDATATPLAPVRGDRIRMAVTTRVTYAAMGGMTGIREEQLRFGMLALDPDARVRVSSDRNFSFSAPPQQTGEHATMTVSSVIDIPRGVSTLRIGVASRSTGRVGTVHLPVLQPDFSRDELRLSGVILSSVFAGRAPSATTTDFEALVPLRPTLARTFDSSDTLRVFVRLFPPSGEFEDLETAVTVVSEGEVVQAAQVRCEVGPVEGALDCQADLQLAALERKAYTLTVAARQRDGKVASRSIGFRIQ